MRINEFLSGEGIIEYHWVKENRLTSWRKLTLADLELQVEMQSGGEGEKVISFDSKFMLEFMNELDNSTWITYIIIVVVDE